MWVILCCLTSQMEVSEGYFFWVSMKRYVVVSARGRLLYIRLPLPPHQR